MFEYARLFLILATNYICEVTLFTYTMKKQKSIIPLYTLLFARAIFQNIYLTHYLPSMNSAPWVYYLNIGTEITYTILLFVFCGYTFYSEENSMSKILFYVIVCDIVIGFLYIPAISSVNMIKGRELFDDYGALSFIDILYPVIMGGATYLLIKLGRKFLDFLQTYQLKHPTILGIFSVVYYSLSVFSAANGPYTKTPITQTVLLLAYALMILPFLIAIVIRLNRSVMLRNDALYASRKLMNDYDVMIQKNIEDINEQAKEINDMMNELVQKEFPEDLTRDYLADIKERQASLYHTLYTDYYLIDALLSYKSQEFTENHIQYQFQLNGLDLKSIKQSEICQLLMALFRSTQDSTSYDLQLSTIRNQVILKLQISYPFNKKEITRLVKRNTQSEYSIDISENILIIGLINE